MVDRLFYDWMNEWMVLGNSKCCGFDIDFF